MKVRDKSSKAHLRAKVFLPSSPAERKRLEAGLSLIRKEAPWLSVSLELPKTSGLLPYLSAPDDEQARRFTDLLGQQIDIIWAARGGYGTLRWVNMIRTDDLEQQNSPPLLIGFSDVTILHLLYLKLGWLSLHAPLVTTLPDTSTDYRQALWSFLLEKRLPKLEGIPLVEGQATGRLVGGNLACVMSCMGTSFEPELEGNILVLEDLNEPLYKIDRMLTQLLLSGRLSGVAGICIGQFKDHGVKEEEFHRLLKDRLSHLGIPVVYDLPFGHTEKNAPLLLGAMYRISFSQLFCDEGYIKKTFKDPED